MQESLPKGVDRLHKPRQQHTEALGWRRSALSLSGAAEEVPPPQDTCRQQRDPGQGAWLGDSVAEREVAE